ncbi:hypothetical protein [Pseudomonas fluorescens]|uniref:hypothetical protein n=1 Tax=Pseudomonas fluorescens TaxID=294 RepID=UPI0020C456CC|nr:hypothetical protein [Pseudomonas fluorescens]UTL92455.1 hypothetical protein NLL86_06890 [Pseudomonas fluorescens]
MSELKAVSSEELGQSICKAFGLDPSKVTGMVVRIHPGKPASVEVTGLVEEPEAAQLTEQLIRYELVPAQG